MRLHEVRILFVVSGSRFPAYFIVHPVPGPIQWKRGLLEQQGESDRDRMQDHSLDK
jgi:hypothetical protein